MSISKALANLPIVSSVGVLLIVKHSKSLTYPCVTVCSRLEFRGIVEYSDKTVLHYVFGYGTVFYYSAGNGQHSSGYKARQTIQGNVTVTLGAGGGTSSLSQDVIITEPATASNQRSLKFFMI